MEEIRFWVDKEKRLINPDLFSKIANDWAQEINKEGGNKKNKRSQIRKFYDEVLMFYERLKMDNSKFEESLPYIKLLIAKVYYALGREHITEKFTKFIEISIEQVKTWEDFAVFKNFFEAFMGFYRFYNRG